MTYCPCVMRPQPIPDEFCDRCGSQLWAYPMDVGYVEVICHECDNATKPLEES